MFRHTQIIATIRQDQPKEEIIKMIEAGMNIARFDLQNGKEDLKNVEATLKVFHEAAEEFNEKRRKQGLRKSSVVECRGVHIATALDLKGSIIETGSFGKADDAAIPLITGGEVLLKNGTDSVTDQSIDINFPSLASLEPDQVITIDGNISLVVTSVETEPAEAVKCRIEKGGDLRAGVKMEVNFPGGKTDLTDVADDIIPVINFCKRNGVDILLAPINNPNAFNMIKCTVSADGSAKVLKVVAKLEGAAAVQSIDKIIERADGVMLNRDRLGRNMPPEQVIVHQKCVIAKCLKAGIPSMVASDLLKSMAEGGEPTRAETADVVNAILDGADCAMLEESVSNENCIKTLWKAIQEAEDMINHRKVHADLLAQVTVPPNPATPGDFTNSTAIAACTAALVNGAHAIIVLTESGRTARMVSKYRPACPIIAVTRSPDIARQCLMSRGVLSIDVGGEC